ncbi:unnamed protein product [Gongylonema pulchrum]|uniref:Integrase n=1 Tax=Gongylonema pulchrum TaxID=637853 RepID=A0A183DZ93_9BILA|nr:unnamed protein product [Gongylonema pulchrum]
MNKLIRINLSRHDASIALGPASLKLRKDKDLAKRLNCEDVGYQRILPRLYASSGLLVSKIGWNRWWGAREAVYGGLPHRKNAKRLKDAALRELLRSGNLLQKSIF